MRHRSWKIWIAGIALAQLLVIGVDVALLWPSEAEQMARRIHKGMTCAQVLEVAGGPDPDAKEFFSPHFIFPNFRNEGLTEEEFGYIFEDGSRLYIGLACLDHGKRLEFPVLDVRTQPPPRVDPLTYLRRTLSRLIPALKE